MKSFFTTVALVALTAPALAQITDQVVIADASIKPEDSERIVVSATRLPTPVAEVASSVTVITAADIEARQQRSLPDVLRNVPGLNIVQTGGAGGQTSMFMRGTNSNHTKVLLDGIDIADPSTPNGAADISKLLAGDIAQVEVLRGPQGALYGSDAIGGVINIITKSGEGPLKINADAEGGSFDTFNQRASASGSQGDLHYAVTVQHLHSGATPVTPLNLLPPGQRRNDDFYDNVTASTKLGYDVTDNFDLGLVGRYTNSLGKITGDSFDPVTFASFPSPTRTRIETLQYESRATAHLVLWDGPGPDAGPGLWQQHHRHPGSRQWQRPPDRRPDQAGLAGQCAADGRRDPGAGRGNGARCAASRPVVRLSLHLVARASPPMPAMPNCNRISALACMTAPRSAMTTIAASATRPPGASRQPG